MSSNEQKLESSQFTPEAAQLWDGLYGEFAEDEISFVLAEIVAIILARFSLFYNERRGLFMEEIQEIEFVELEEVEDLSVPLHHNNNITDE